MPEVDGKMVAIWHARMMKASKLAGFIFAYRADGLPITGAWVRALPADSRRTTEYLTGTRLSSDETWELVAQIIDGMLAHPTTDPFANLT